jgi:hypothetical protein
MRRLLGGLFAVVVATGLPACSSSSSHAITWQTARASLDDQQLTVGYASDVCQDLDRVEVAYGKADVTVTVFAVSNDRACVGVRFPQAVQVPLRQSLAGRIVRDGAHA